MKEDIRIKRTITAHRIIPALKNLFLSKSVIFEVYTDKYFISRWKK